MPLDGELIEALELQIEEALAELFDRPRPRWPHRPSPETLHLMAKAAASVYEAAAESARSR